MTPPVPSPASTHRPATLKYRLDHVKAGKPLPVTVYGHGLGRELQVNDVKRQIATLRVNASNYGKRHGIKLVVRIVRNFGTWARVRVVWDGRRT